MLIKPNLTQNLRKGYLTQNPKLKFKLDGKADQSETMSLLIRFGDRQYFYANAF